MPKKSKFVVLPNGTHEAIRVINGKRVAFRGKTDREVETKMLQYKADMAAGRLFRAVADDFKAEHWPDLAPNTLRSYNAAYDRAVAQFGGMPVRSITPPQIKAYINSFAQGRAKKTVTTQRQMLHMIFRWGVEHGDLQINPCTEVTLPKGLKKDYRQPATEADVEKVRGYVDKWLLPYLLLYTGLRKGEALALQGADIDLKGREIHVRKSVYYDYGTPRIKLPKSEAGYRVVPILDALAAKLPKVKPAEFLFSCDGGVTPYAEKDYIRLWETFKRETGAACTAHMLRHNYATMLLDAGLDLKDRQDLLGHSTAAMTQDIYTHIEDKRRKAAADALNKSLSEAQKKSGTRKAPPKKKSV